MENNILTINNKEIFDFYKQYNIDFESMNLLFLNVLKKIIHNFDNSLNTNIATNLLEKINSLTSKVDLIESNFSTLINNKFSDYKKEYLSDIKLLLNSNNIEFLSPLMKERNDNLIDKTSLIINEMIPKNCESINQQLNLNLNILKSSILSETTTLLSSTLDKKTIEDFLKNINSTMNQSYSTLTTLISSSENRIEGKLLNTENKINEMKGIFTENNSSQQILQNNVTEMLKKFEKGVGKGNISEHITYNILLSLYPCAQIDHIGNELKESGDIILIRNNKPKILIENKDHDSKNVPKSEIDKFIRDCEIQNCCGIMFAQHKGITNKQNFEIQINNGNVLLYVHEVNFDVDKIKTAVEIVENFKMKLDEVVIKEDDCIIEREILQDINKEFVNYINQKFSLLKLIKDFNEKINFSINELKMPTLEKFLSSKFAFSINQSDNVCKYCEKIIPKSLSQHYRYCSSKKDFEVQNNIEPNDSELENINTIVIPSNPEIKKTKKK